MTAWTHEARAQFIAWHDSVIAPYPPRVRDELRDARLKFLGRLPRQGSMLVSASAVVGMAANSRAGNVDSIT